MTLPTSDALVFFSATGDLAYKQIFPALQAMIRHGHLDMPIIGVAKSGWNLDQLRHSWRRDPLRPRGWGRGNLACRRPGSGECNASLSTRPIRGDHLKQTRSSRTAEAGIIQQ